MSRTRAQFIQAQTHTEAERDALAVVEQGRLVWNSTTGRFQVYNGSAWRDVFITGDSVPGADITGQIDGDLLYNRVDGALLWNTVDGTLLVGSVNGALLTNEVDGTLLTGSVDASLLSGTISADMIDGGLMDGGTF